MSSTEDDKGRDAVAALFDDVLLPLSQAAAARPAPFRTRPDASCGTYYQRRSSGAITREAFRAPACANAEQFERRLAAFWRAAGRPDLAGYAPHFATAARAAHVAGDQDIDVSPLVYVMF